MKTNEKRKENMEKPRISGANLLKIHDPAALGITPAAQALASHRAKGSGATVERKHTFQTSVA